MSIRSALPEADRMTSCIYHRGIIVVLAADIWLLSKYHPRPSANTCQIRRGDGQVARSLAGATPAPSQHPDGTLDFQPYRPMFLRRARCTSTSELSIRQGPAKASRPGSRPEAAFADYPTISPRNFARTCPIYWPNITGGLSAT